MSSPQDVDPLSWFTGPLVPLVLGALAFVHATVYAVATWDQSALPHLQFVAIAFIVSACIIIHFMTRPQRPSFTAARAAVPLALGIGGLVLSGIGYAGGQLRLEHWWAPVALGFLLTALAPYASVRTIIVAGIVACAVAGTVTVAWMLPQPHPQYWPPVTQLFIGIGSLLVASTGASFFAYWFVSGILKWSVSQGDARLSDGPLSEAARARVLRAAVAGVAERATPLLRRVAGRGVVTERDRSRAAALARELRGELVEQSNRSWLEALAAERPMVVIDPGRRADGVAGYQRSALRSLLQAALDDPELGSPDVLIELREEPDGSTAVALSMDVHLPEGRRVMLLAPHYLTLKTAVDDLSWRGGEVLRLRFRLRAESGQEA